MSRHHGGEARLLTPHESLRGDPRHDHDPSTNSHSFSPRERKYSAELECPPAISFAANTAAVRTFLGSNWSTTSASWADGTLRLEETLETLSPKPTPICSEATTDGEGDSVVDRGWCGSDSFRRIELPIWFLP